MRTVTDVIKIFTAISRTKHTMIMMRMITTMKMVKRNIIILV